jgi:hypothetical protein
MSKCYLSRIEKIDANEFVKSRMMLALAHMSAATVPLYDKGRFMGELSTKRAIVLEDQGIITVTDGVAQKA